MTGLAQCLPLAPQTAEFDPAAYTHMRTSQAWLLAPVPLTLGRWEQESPWGLLASQSS